MFTPQASLEGKLAVALRGDCLFSLKAQVAQEQGALALIVISTSEGTPLGKIRSFSCKIGTDWIALDFAVRTLSTSQKPTKELVKVFHRKATLQKLDIPAKLPASLGRKLHLTDSS
jgi:hypothetical protein